MGGKGVENNPLWGGYPRDSEPACVHHCYFQCANNDPSVAQLWGYTDALGYASGDTVALHASTTAEAFALRVYRDGAEERTVLRAPGIAGAFHETPADCSVTGCGWPAAHRFDVGADWPSGVYVAELTAAAADGSALEYHHLFVVRPSPGDKAGRLLLIAATGTWTAYNDCGGSNHYEGITGENGDDFSPTLSLQRPWASGFVKLPGDEPRIPLRQPPPMGWPLRYPHMEWCYANGYTKKYASAGWAHYDRHYLHWLEDVGYAVDVIPGQDLHFRPETIDGYACLTCVGHDEYWSWEMRDAIDAYVERGGNVARFAGNFLWQIRIEDEGRRQVCYKYRSRAEDPLFGGERQHLTTNCWDAAETGRPGARTFGLSGTRGVYAGWGGCAPRGPGGFNVYRPDHWAFEGADLYYGDVLGGPSRVFGYEVDGVDHIVKDGLPYATGADGAPDNLEIIAMGLCSVHESDHGNGAEPFVGERDSEFLAATVEGEATPEQIARYTSGSGMIAAFERGQGGVFTAGSCEWVAGLIDRDEQVERVTRNVLDRFLG